MFKLIDLENTTILLNPDDCQKREVSNHKLHPQRQISLLCSFTFLVLIISRIVNLNLISITSSNSSHNTQASIVILVHTTVGHRRSRDLIRDTWGANFPPQKPTRLLFAIGKFCEYVMKLGDIL